MSKAPHPAFGWLRRCNALEQAVLMALWAYARLDEERPKVTPSAVTLAGWLGKNERSIRRALTRLEEIGAIHRLDQTGVGGVRPSVLVRFGSSNADNVVRIGDGQSGHVRPDQSGQPRPDMNPAIRTEVSAGSGHQCPSIRTEVSAKPPRTTKEPPRGELSLLDLEHALQAAGVPVISPPRLRRAHDHARALGVDALIGILVHARDEARAAGLTWRADSAVWEPQFTKAVESFNAANTAPSRRVEDQWL